MANNLYFVLGKDTTKRYPALFIYFILPFPYMHKCSRQNPTEARVILTLTRHFVCSDRKIRV